MSSNVLYKTRCYLVGHMQYAQAHFNWREYVEQQLAERHITFFNPLKKPFLTAVNETASTRNFLMEKLRKKEGQYVYNHMKQIRVHDLNLVDRSDFIIAHLIPNVASWGSAEEIVCANRMKKPIFISISGGCRNVPLWLAGMLPPNYFYDDVHKIVDMIKEIDDNKKELDSDRWRLLDKKYR